MTQLTTEILQRVLGAVDSKRPKTVALIAHLSHLTRADAGRALAMLHVQGYLTTVHHRSSDGINDPLYIRTDKPESEVVGAERAK